PHRLNIIITRDSSFKASGVIVANSLEEALRQAQGKLSESVDSEIFIIGGGQIFKEAIDVTDKIYLTLIEGKFDVDTYFPDYSKFTKKVSEEEGESNGFKYKFINLEKSRLIS
ncbi:MAG: dihydrofolate reductase, partial [Candidatus Levybacteria bacterium CG22_combo_CG10-13_8_21_14_all_35_11]